MNKEKNIHNSLYPCGAVNWLLILHLYIDLVIVIKQFNVVGAIAVVLLNSILVITVRYSKHFGKYGISEYVADFYLMDIVVFTAMNVQKITVSMQAYNISSKSMDIWIKGYGYAYIVAMAIIAVLCLAFNSKIWLFIYSLVILLMFRSGDIFLTATVVKSLIILVVFFAIWGMLDNWRIKTKRQTEEYARVRKAKRLWKLIYILVIPLWLGFIWNNRNYLNWNSICSAFDIIYSKWVVIPVIVVVSFLVKKLVAEVQTRTSEWLMDTYYLALLLLLYVLVGVSFVRYTTLNILLIWMFLRYSRRKIFRGLECGNLQIRLLRLLIYFVNLVIVEIFISSGLMLNTIVTLIMEYMLIQTIKKKLKINSEGWEQRINGEEAFDKKTIKAIWNKSTANISLWIDCILAIAVQAICVICSRRLMANSEYINILGIGAPNFKCFIVLGVIVGIIIAEYVLLFMKNPMNVKPQLYVCITVMTVYIVAMFFFMKSVSGIRIYQTRCGGNAEIKIEKSSIDEKTPPMIYVGNIFNVYLQKDGYLEYSSEVKNSTSKFSTCELNSDGLDSEKYMIMGRGKDNSMYVNASYCPTFIRNIFDKKDVEYSAEVDRSDENTEKNTDSKGNKKTKKKGQSDTNDMSESIKHKISKIVVNNAENDLTTDIQHMEYGVKFIYFHWKIESAPTEGLNIKYVLEYTDGYSYEGVAEGKKMAKTCIWL